MHPRLLETLRQAQRFGFFGDRDIEEAVDHARGYVDAIGPLAPAARLVDLGSGGGLPGLVLADAYPATSILLVDRRQKRTDFLELAVQRLGWDHVVVRCDDARRVVDEVATGVIDGFDVVTARGFGPPEMTLRVAAGLRHPTGRVVISEPPAGDRWAPTLLDELGLTSRRVGHVRLFSAR